MLKDDVYLMFVDPDNDGTQSNKFYNMFDKGNGTFTVEYGRVGSTKTTLSYPSDKWNSTYKSKVKKGYKDISDLKAKHVVAHEDSGNKSFDDFYTVFQKYTGSMVRKTYLVEGCSQGQIDEAQALLNKMSKVKKVDEFNKYLVEIYKIIPRRMSDVRSHMLSDIKKKDSFIQREQDALDSMDSSNITNTSNPFKSLGIRWEEMTNHKQMEDLLYPTMDKNYRYGARQATIHKVYKITDDGRTKMFDDWVAKQSNKHCELLIHGTRCPNVFSILKSGLLVRPTNAASFAGSVYGDGVYHSAHSAKSLGYVGNDPDKLFFIQNVHMGKYYTYEGWYRDGKDLSRNEMNYPSLQKKGGYDSLYVKAGDGLLNSEYIVYNSDQTNTNFLVWMK